jgi:hypothetical protein
MPVIQIRPAQRANSRLVIGLASVSGDGKTYTALQLGYGLANYNAAKVGMLDTENRRGSLYDDCLEQATRPTKDRFLIGDLVAPFTPQRYIDAIREFEAAGVEVLIIDSVTHEWEGIGGCQEIAEAGNPKMPNWNFAKKEHKRFMNTMLQCDMHIIVCVRAREKTKPERDAQGKMKFVELGLQPIQEKNFMFEMTASLMLFDQGSSQSILKVPANLLSILGRREGYITADDGKRLRDWNDGALKLDPVVEKFRNRLISNTEGGVAHIQSCWEKTPKDVRAALGDAFHGTLVSSAKSYDDLKEMNERAEEEEAGDPPADPEDTRQAQQIAAKARANGEAETPKRSGTQLLPGADKSPTSAKQPDQPGAEQPSKQPDQPKDAPKPEQKPTPAASRRPPSALPLQPKQQDLAPPVTGVLDSDPVF